MVCQPYLLIKIKAAATEDLTHRGLAAAPLPPGPRCALDAQEKVGPGSRRERSPAGYPSWQDWLRPRGPRAHPKSAVSPPRSGPPPADASVWIASRDWRYSPGRPRFGPLEQPL